MWHGSGLSPCRKQKERMIYEVEMMWWASLLSKQFILSKRLGHYNIKCFYMCISREIGQVLQQLQHHHYYLIFFGYLSSSSSIRPIVDGAAHDDIPLW